MRYSIPTLLIALISGLSLQAQVVVDFENGIPDSVQVSASDRWGTDQHSPLEGAFSLHHIYDNPENGHDQLAFPLYDLDLTAGDTQWEFLIRYGYAPSSLNNWSFFLLANRGPECMYPGGPLSALVFGVNFSGSDDLLKLWKVEGGSNTLLFSTEYNWQDSVPPDAVVHLRICRSAAGAWSFFLNREGKAEVSLGQTQASWTPPSAYGGIYYQYSSTKDRLLWLDRLRIDGTFVRDTVPPDIRELRPDRLHRITLSYSEAVDTQAASSPSNYFLEPMRCSPDSVSPGSDDTYCLYFPKAFERGKAHRLSIGEIQDIKGNIAQDLSREFDWYYAGPGDLVFSEIMYDPFPVVQLPEQEYLEICNNSEYPLSLLNSRLYIGETPLVLPDYVLEAGAYLFISGDSLPALSNAGTVLALTDSMLVVLDALHYQPSWGSDPLKTEGGWALERIDPAYAGGSGDNWDYSRDLRGGTPGDENSRKGQYVDTDSPFIRQAWLEEDTLEVAFSERIPAEGLYDPAMYSTDPWLEMQLIPASGFPLENRLRWWLQSPPVDFSLYSLQLDPTLQDYAGHAFDPGFGLFGRFGSPDTASLLITEILYDPGEEQTEFVEVKNVSGQVLDLADYRLATSAGLEANRPPLVLSAQPRALLPDSVYVLCSGTTLFKVLPAGVQRRIVEVPFFPSLSNEGGCLLLYNSSLQVLEKACYQPAMHHPWLAETKGVSLERISQNNAGTAFYNWHSSTNLCYGASPGLYRESTDSLSQERTCVVEPQVFSPDMDGYMDEVYLRFPTAGEGDLLTLRVYDLVGRQLGFLYILERVLPDTALVWDGRIGEVLQPAGTYILFLELVSPDGSHQQWKKAVRLTYNARK